MAIVTLITYDKQSITVEKDIATKSEFIRQMLEDYEEDETPDVNLLNPHCTVKIVKLVVRCLQSGLYENIMDNVDITDLKKMVKACDYLDIKDLLECCCSRIANIFKSCKTVDDIKERFKLQKELTEEERGRLEEFFKIMN